VFSAGIDTPLWLLAPMALLVVQELIGRAMFYGSYFRVGV
jgi:hypothetical protein